jgi:hypothetical protein
MNKGFILDGYPRSVEDANNIFMDKTLIAKTDPNDETEEQKY